MESLLSRRNLVLSIIITCFMLLLSSSEAYTSNNGNITIKWDLVAWTTDGYIAVVTIYNHQKDRSICVPGWTLGWRWNLDEVIWNVIGAKTTEKEECSSRFKEHNIPHSCVKNPRVVDLLPGAPYNQQIANCCRGGVLESGTTSAFQISVGNAGTMVETVMMPVKFVFLAPEQRYMCGPARNVQPTIFVPSGKGRRRTKALMTWNVVCNCMFYEET